MTTRVSIGIVVGMCSVSGVLYGLSLAGQPPARAVGVIPTPEAADLGTVEQGQEVSFTFALKNTLARPITIAAVLSSCGCAWFDDEIKGKRFEPGQTIPVRGVFDTKDRRGRTESHAVLSYRTEPSVTERKLILTVRALVRPTLRVTPEPLVFELGPASGGPLTEEITIDSDQVDEFAVISAECPVPGITVELIDRDFLRDHVATHPARVRVTLDPVAWGAGAPFSSSARPFLRVRTTAMSEPTLLVPIDVERPQGAITP